MDTPRGAEPQEAPPLESQREERIAARIAALFAGHHPVDEVVEQSYDSLERRPDAIVQASVDRRTLATILRYLVSQGYQPSTRSDLYRTIVEEFEALLVANGVEKYATTEEAHAYLLSQVVGGWNPRGRLRRNLLQNLKIDPQPKHKRRAK